MAGADAGMSERLLIVNAAELLLTARRASAPAKTLAYWRERLPSYGILFPDLDTCDIWADITARCHAK